MNGIIRLDRLTIFVAESLGGGTVEQYVFVRLHAREGQESAIEEALRGVTGPTRQEVGCLSFHTFRSMRDRRLFYIHSRWVDEAAFQKHAGLLHTVRSLERVDTILDQPRDVTRTEMIGCAPPLSWRVLAAEPAFVHFWTLSKQTDRRWSATVLSASGRSIFLRYVEEERSLCCEGQDEWCPDRGREFRYLARGEVWMRDNTTSSAVRHAGVHKKLRKKEARGGAYVHWDSEGPA